MILTRFVPVIKSSFGFRSSLRTIDVTEPCPADISLFEHCATVYFGSLRTAQMGELYLREGVREFWEKESSIALKEYACKMVHASVQAAINQRKMPNAQEMAHLGKEYNDDEWSQKHNGGGYCAVVDAASALALCYFGSTNKFSRRLPKQHWDPLFRANYPQNELYKALSAGRKATWTSMFEFDEAFPWADEWSMLRQKLLEAFLNALFAIYRACDFKRTGPELQIAELWSGIPLRSRDDVEALEKTRGFVASNRSVAYAEETQSLYDPFKDVFKGATGKVLRSDVGKVTCIRLRAERWKYTFALTEEQRDALQSANVEYGTFRAHQTADGTPHQYQYAGIVDGVEDPAFEDAESIAFSFTYRSRDVGGEPRGEAIEIWLNAASWRGVQTSVLTRALFALSLKEYALDTYRGTSAGPTRFPFPARESTKEAKVWHDSTLKATRQWVDENYAQHLRDDGLQCPWCRYMFRGGDAESLRITWLRHIRQGSAECFKELLRAIELDEEEIVKHVIACHCGRHVHSQFYLERHWRLQENRDCLEMENAYRAVNREPLLDITEDDMHCPYCGLERTMIDEKKHLSANIHAGCLAMYNMDQEAKNMPIFVPTRCRQCELPFRNEGELKRHLFSVSHQECLDAESAYRKTNGLEPLTIEMQYCQEPVCEQDYQKLTGERARTLQNKPGFRFSSHIASYMTEHYKQCHPSSARPKKADLLRNPDEVGQGVVESE
jgi:hypothetical protein